MDYEIFKIKSYNQWDLYLHKEQFPYIGRCYAASKRSNAHSIINITPDESLELTGVIIPAWFDAVTKLYKATWPNVAILGNDWRHLHAHLIPRFDNSGVYHGIKFTDPQPTKNYAPYPRMRISDEILFEIRDEIGSKL